ncbi:MAG: hypothetical protein H7317_10180 [Pseudorhodobacter sp.]|nr:hypothetical protein [Pseudorhodobacter sp.]
MGWVGRSLALALLAAPLAAMAQNAEVEPDFSVWAVKFGEPLAQIPDTAAAIIACGSKGGPASIPLKSFADWAQCTPEVSGLREVQFSYDDEKDYIARAMEMEYRALAGGTSVYAHPVVVSVLVDDTGTVQGIRITSDDRVSDHDRRTAFVLSRNLKARFVNWALACTDIPAQNGEMPVGNQFIHERCRGANPAQPDQQVLLETSYLRKKGQRALSQETQQVNKGYYQSRSWLEIVNKPYSPSEAP